MTELKLPEIMLFGQKISLPDNGKILVLCSDEGAREATGDSSPDGSLSSDPDSCLISSENCLDDERENGLGEDGEILPDENEIVETQEDQIASESAGAKSSEYIPPPATDETANSKPLMESDDNSKTPSIDEETAAAKSTKNDCDQNDTTSSEQKPLKKPDKILPCPRCNSMDTKFCYYNNYNVNQPRHFCKNCQRYWTAGGNMRNVPVGAGRRKSKNPNSYCRHITIPEALQAARIDVRNGFHHPVLKTNGRFLSFGSDMPRCDSVASVLNIADKKAVNGTMNGFYNLEQGIPIACKTAEKADNSSNGSSVTTSNSIAEKGKDCQQESIIQNTNGFPNQIACLPGVPWPCPWNPSVPMPAICPPGFPMPFFPTPFWNCGVPGPWGIPLLSPPSPSTSQKGSGSGPNSPTLGKHSRDGDLLKLMEPEGNSPGESEKEGYILVPKTLRINDPDEAANSSIWTTIGIKNESINRRGLFKGFQPKDNENKHVATFSLLSQANPAALSRSFSFQENA